MKNIGQVSPAQDRYYSPEDISVRIGSAVDRSVRRDTASGSRDRREIHSVFSDELLDNGGPASVRKTSTQSRSAQGSSQPPSSRLHDYGQRDILTPSAFMNDSSSESSFRSLDHHSGKTLSPSTVVRSLKSVKNRDTRANSEVESLSEQPPEDTGFKSAFKGFIDPPAHDEGIDRASPFFRDFAGHANALTRSPRPLGEPVYHGNGQKHTLHSDNNLKTNGKAIWDHQRDLVMPLVQKKAPKKANEDLELSDSKTQNLDALSKSTTFEAPSPDVNNDLTPYLGPREDITKLRGQVKAMKPGETLPEWEIIPMSHGQERKAPSRIESNSNAIPKAFEDEEAVWRKFVFGDELPNDETSQEPDPSSHELDPQYHHEHTQPSLIAEAATSPLMLNPHLGDETFEL